MHFSIDFPFILDFWRLPTTNLIFRKDIKALTFCIIVVDCNVIVVMVYGEILFARINFQYDAHIETALVHSPVKL